MESRENRPDCTIFLLAKAYQKGHSLLKSRLRKYNLTNMQHLVLEGIWFKEGCTAAEMGRLLVLDKATISGVIDRLMTGNWIRKTEDSDDKRSNRLYPSDKATKLKSELLTERKIANEELLSQFSFEERVLFKRLLWELLDIDKTK